MIISYNGKSPVLGKNVYVAPSALVIGDVVIDDEASVWFGAVIRADRDRITIGARTNVQDNCTLHVDTGSPLIIGSDVTIGHNAVIHGCTVEDQVLIGINAVVLNHAVIGRGSVVGAGAVIGETMTVGPFELAAGVPAKIKKSYDAQRAVHNVREAAIYVQLARDYMAGEKA
jgi:carbonic anhydrase/acetyltransferase-like protein (isoleucine patch superfamily)